MSNFRKSALTLAIVAGMAASGVASAASIVPNTGFPEGVAFFDIASATTQVGIAVAPGVTVNVDPTDNIIGRTTGFAIRVSLSNGATFAANPTFTTGAALPAGWTTSIGAGGAGSSTMVINFNPPNTNPVPGVGSGPLVTLTPADAELAPTVGHILTSLTALQVPNQTVTESFQFFDPVSTNNILNPAPVASVLQSGNPVVTACNLTNRPYPQLYTKIDVSANTSQASRTYFSLYGNIGGTQTGLYNAGQIQISTAPNFSYFSYNATDSFTTTVNGSFGAFNQAGAAVFLSKNSNCSTQDVVGTLNATGTQASFTYGLGVLGATFPATAANAQLCFSVPSGNTQTIAATTISQQTSFTRNALTVNGPACSLNAMSYNGPVVHVYTFNPAGNTTQQSFLRISNTGPSAGPVFITGIDDAGNPGAGTVSVNLNAGQSIQLTSTDLQNGNAGKGLTGALGTPNGKWRLTVTSYFPNLVVTSLNRNNNSGTVTNLTNYDVNGKQNLWGYYGDNGN